MHHSRQKGKTKRTHTGLHKCRASHRIKNKGIEIIFFSRIMLMVYELDVLQSDCERIGDPVALPLTNIINNSGNTNRLGKILTHSFNNILFKLF